MIDRSLAPLFIPRHFKQRHHVLSENKTVQEGDSARAGGRWAVPSRVSRFWGLWRRGWLFSSGHLSVGGRRAATGRQRAGYCRRDLAQWNGTPPLHIGDDRRAPRQSYTPGMESRDATARQSGHGRTQRVNGQMDLAGLRSDRRSKYVDR